MWFPTSGEFEWAHAHQASDLSEAIARHGAVYVETLGDALAQMNAAVGDREGMKPIVITGKSRDKGDGNA